MAEAGFGLSQGERAAWEEVQGDQSGEKRGRFPTKVFSGEKKAGFSQ